MMPGGDKKAELGEARLSRPQPACSRCNLLNVGHVPGYFGRGEWDTCNLFRRFGLFKQTGS